MRGRYIFCLCNIYSHNHFISTRLSVQTAQFFLIHYYYIYRVFKYSPRHVFLKGSQFLFISESEIPGSTPM